MQRMLVQFESTPSEKRAKNLYLQSEGQVILLRHAIMPADTLIAFEEFAMCARGIDDGMFLFYACGKASVLPQA